MIELAVVAAVAIIALSVALVAVLVLHGRERLEWAKERRSLVDRAIARHTAEVVALEREARKSDQPEQPTPQRLHPIAEGM